MTSAAEATVTWAIDPDEAREFRREWQDKVSTAVARTRPLTIVRAEQRPIPLLAVRRYAEEAVRVFRDSKQYDDGTWFMRAEGFDGPWSDGVSEREATTELVDVIYEWALMKIEDRDRDFPVVPGTFDLNSI
jgi:hypothetical protein